MKKILIIDYDQSALTALQTVFSGQGYQVVIAADGQTGWDKYNKESPDLVLMEAMLPKIHGFELCQRITSERNSQTTVFIMTGVYKDRVYRTEALRTYGASEYFEKPLKMAELVASVEAVLGKPQSMPAEEPQAAPAPVPPRRPEPKPADPRRHEKPKDDDAIFALPEDLDRLSREIPKFRKPGSAPSRRETPADDARLDALTDDLLKNVLVGPTPPAKTVVPKPAGGNGNGNGNGSAEIDSFLKSALAGLDLTKEKVKVPKTAPLPPAPVKAKPAPTPPPAPAVQAKPRAVTTPAPAVEQKPRPTPPPPAPMPTPSVSMPSPAKADIKCTLTPGDPGSDISPFFTPEKTKAQPVAEKPRVPLAEKKAAPAPEPVRRETVLPETPRREPAQPEPVRPEPAVPKPQEREAEAIAAADIFGGIAEGTGKKGFPKVVAVAAGVVAVAAVGFILLRPKHQAPAPDANQTSQQAVNPSSDLPAQPAETAAAPEIKPAPVKPKVQPKAKPAAAEPAGAEAILPTESNPAALPPLTAPADKGTPSGQPGPGSNPAAADAPAAKTTESNPPVADTAANPAQGAPAGAGTTTETAAPAPAPAPAPAAAAVSEGALVALGSVTEPPKLVKSANPIYPAAAQRLGLGGSITVNALIDEKGNVIDTGILKGIQDDNGLGKAAETAVKKWRFQPARVNGVAVKVWKPFVIVFKPEANPVRSMA